MMDFLVDERTIRHTEAEEFDLIFEMQFFNYEMFM